LYEEINDRQTTEVTVTVTKRIEVGIIGCGFVSTAHAAGYLEDERTEIVAVCDVRPEVLGARAKEWGARRKYRDYGDLLKDEEVDAVDICVPPYLHAKITVEAAESGKHVLVEKPMCASLRQADEMISAAEKAGVCLMVGESYVFTTTHMKARELIDENAIGKPIFLNERMGLWLPRKLRPGSPSRDQLPFRADPMRSCGGLYRDAIDHFPHAMATARYLMQNSEINRIYAWAIPTKDRYGQEERVFISATWQYKSADRYGTWIKLGKFDWPGGFSTVVGGTEGSIEVLGEGGGPAVSSIKPCPLVLYKEGKAYHYGVEGEPDLVWISEINYYNKAHRNEVRHFIDCLVDGKKPRYSGGDGRIDLRLTLTAIRSAIEEKPLDPDSLPEDWTAYSQS